MQISVTLLVAAIRAGRGKRCRLVPKGAPATSD